MHSSTHSCDSKNLSTSMQYRRRYLHLLLIIYLWANFRWRSLSGSICLMRFVPSHLADIRFPTTTMTHHHPKSKTKMRSFFQSPTSNSPPHTYIYDKTPRPHHHRRRQSVIGNLRSINVILNLSIVSVAGQQNITISVIYFYCNRTSVSTEYCPSGDSPGE
jgi:hypothetical protein